MARPLKPQRGHMTKQTDTSIPLHTHHVPFLFVRKSVPVLIHANASRSGDPARLTSPVSMYEIHNVTTITDTCIDNIQLFFAVVWGPLSNTMSLTQCISNKTCLLFSVALLSQRSAHPDWEHFYCSPSCLLIP